MHGSQPFNDNPKLDGSSIPATYPHLDESELARLRVLFKEAPGFVAIVEGPDLVYRLVNPAYCRLVDHRNLLGRPLGEARPELKAQGYIALATDVYKTGKTFVGRQMRVELQVQPDEPACIRYVDFVFQPLFDTVGRPAGVFIQGHDVTDQKLAQDALVTSNQRWQFAIEGAQDGIWDWNVPTDEIFVSRRYLEILGYPEGDSIDSFDARAEDLHPDDRLLVLSQLRALLEGGPLYRAEFRLRRKDGTYIWAVSRGMVVERDASGKPVRVAGTMTDISAQKRAEDEAWRASSFDALTGLPNRRLILERLEKAIKQTAGNDELAVMLIDMDRFREVNDLYGHTIGNELLAQAADRLKACVRQLGTVARLGGDEFLVVLTNIHGRDHVANIAQDLITKLAAPFRVAGDRMHLSASIGITFCPQDARVPEELLRNADQAMHAAKKAGRNQFRFFAKALRAEAQHRIRLAQDLRQAVAVQQLEVHYQPVIELQSRKITKAEALLRWQHPDLGFVCPAEFIPLAEESGLIHDLGNWVFTETASWSRRWRNKLNGSPQLSVNCSPVQVSSQSAATWLNILDSAGVPPRDIAVEITEGVLLNASSHVTELLHQYRAAGMQIALDDFGTGYSSLKYLMQFDLDYLKIDQSFVQSIDTNEDSRAIVESIIAMAHRLGIKVIAEGIEKPEQAHILRSAGCEYGQGFLFSKALPPSEFEELLMRQ